MCGRGVGARLRRVAAPALRGAELCWVAWARHQYALYCGVWRRGGRPWGPWKTMWIFVCPTVDNARISRAKNRSSSACVATRAGTPYGVPQSHGLQHVTVTCTRTLIETVFRCQTIWRTVAKRFSGMPFYVSDRVNCAARKNRCGDVEKRMDCGVVSCGYCRANPRRVQRAAKPHGAALVGGRHTATLVQARFGVAHHRNQFSPADGAGAVVSWRTVAP